MASGIPVLLIAGGEGAAVVREAEAGVVVAPGDVDALVSALRELAGDPDRRRRLGAAGRKVAERRFDRRQITQAFVERLETESRSRDADRA
jgi:glycosyltransferase involved in cell wall biosynthesis